MKAPLSILPLAVLFFVGLIWSRLAFGGEIHDATTAGNLETVRALLKSDAALANSKSEPKDSTPLLLAAEKDRKEIAELLLANGADVNARDRSGYTALHYAARFNHKEVVELLLNNMAEINAKDSEGQTPLHLAAEKNRLDIVELLLARKADVNAKDDDGKTPLHGALLNSNADVAEMLRQHGGHE